VAWWLQRARECCGDIERRGKRVLLVGGTPLYLKALCCGLFDGPLSDAALRKRLSRDAEEVGPEAMHRRLAAVDPLSAARLHINDVRRVVRALEVWELTQKPLSSFQTQWPAASAPAEFNKAVRIIWLDLPRSELYKRIDDRVLAMFRAGFLEEVAALRALPQPLSREASQALGYKETLDYLDGRMPLDQTIALIQQRTRNFAKRQITWFRHLPGCVPATEQLTRTLWKSTI
jgi:tRNA dimethylallyltransferase